MKKILLILIPLLLVNALVLYGIIQKNKKGSAGPYTIAFVGPTQFEYGRDMANAAQMYLDEINATGGINGRKVNLRLYDDNNDAQKAKIIAQEIADDDQILAAIGYYASRAAIAAGRVYKKNGVPAISSAASEETITIGNPWFFRVRPNNIHQAEYIGQNISRTLKKFETFLVYEDDSYGRSIANNFEDTAKNLAINIRGKWSFSETAMDVDDRMIEIAEKILAIDNSGLVFFAASSVKVASIIKTLKDKGGVFTIVGPDAFGEPVFVEALNKYPKEQKNPGYYSDGIYVSLPFMVDFANAKALNFEKKFMKKYMKSPGQPASSSYDAAKVVVEAIKIAAIDQDTWVRLNRKKIQEALAGFFNQENSVDGISGTIFFDINGDFLRPYAMGIYMKQNLLPAMVQYQEARHPTGVDNIFKKVLMGEYLVINSKYMEKMHVGYMAVDFNQITSLDLQKGQAGIEFTIKLHYPEVFDAFEIVLVGTVDPVELVNPVVDTTANGKVTRIFKVNAVVPMEPQFIDYPSTSYSIPLRVRHSSLKGNRLVQVDTTLPVFSQFNGRPAKDVVETDAEIFPGWILSAQNSYKDVFIKKSSLGVSKYINYPHKTNFSMHEFALTIEKQNSWAKMAKVAPLVLFLAIIVLWLFIPVQRISIRIFVLMATVTAFQFAGGLYSVGEMPLYVWNPIQYLHIGVYLIIGVAVVFSVKGYLNLR